MQQHNSETTGLTLRLDPFGEIGELNGDSDRLLGRSSVDLWRRPVSDIFSAEASATLSQALGDMTQGKATERRVIAYDRPDGQQTHFDLRVGPAGKVPGDGYLVRLAPTRAPDAWEPAATDAALVGTDDDAGSSLDRMAGLMSDGKAGQGITLMSVDGGLGAFNGPDAAMHFRRIVDASARSLGATGTADLSDGAYGVIHGDDYDGARLVSDVGQEAASRGILKDADSLSAETVVADATSVSADAVRGTLSHMLGGLRRGLTRGFKRSNLREAHGKALTAAEKMLGDVRQAIKDGAFVRRMRPILSLKRNKVAMHGIGADLQLNGELVAPEQIFGLVDSDDVQCDFETACVAQAIKHHLEAKTWQSISFRALVSIRQDYLLRQDVRQRIASLAKASGIDRTNLILRPYEPLSGNLNGKGSALVGDESTDAPWCLSVPDFYAFVAGDADRRERPIEMVEKTQGYIEIAADRIMGLLAQKDGRFLVRGLVENWRGRQIELIATSVNKAEQQQTIADLGIRYARGQLIGGWESRY
ncbi:MAG: hypothetical protein P1U65_06170 [Minwuia sp.]|nr:hypothetical protein [Minwuia sp.]